MKNTTILGFVLILTNHFFLSFHSFTQSVNIGLRYTNHLTSEGYTLFTPEYSHSVYLINNCGEKVNEWIFSENPALTCYLLENGNLLRAGVDSLEIRDWNNNQIWSYGTTAAGINQHHDIEPLPNGNILCIAGDVYTNSAALNMGRDPSLSPGQFKLDKIIELQPSGNHSANIVWQWKFADHLIQNFNSSKSNYGVVSEHPELVDINYNNGEPLDYIHLNSIDYNSNLDQILISSRHLSEIFVIDHSTTLLEASGHTGGNSGKGGDIVFRWGNPEVYQPSVQTTRKLYKQHDAKWIQDGYPNAGKITVFNNGGDGSYTYSSIHIITPNPTGFLYDMNNETFLPNDFYWSWNGSVYGDVLNESKKGSIFQLLNNNLLVCATGLGQIFEISPNGDLVWVYKNPVGGSIYQQNQTTSFIDNTIFRADRYDPDFIGFQNKDLSSKGIIEDVNVCSDSCSALNLLKTIDKKSIEMYSIGNHQVAINGINSGTDISFYDLMGNKLSFTTTENKTIYTLTNFSGICIVRIQNNNMSFNEKILVNE